MVVDDDGGGVLQRWLTGGGGEGDGGGLEREQRERAVICVFIYYINIYTFYLNGPLCYKFTQSVLIYKPT